MKDEHIETLIWGLIGILAMIVMLASSARAASWDDAPPEVKSWFQSLKQPDRPEVSCCGTGDAYYVDDLDVVDGKVYATITDNRSNPLPVGTRLEIPPNKMNRDPNILGRYLVFASPGGMVYCFISGSGV